MKAEPAFNEFDPTSRTDWEKRVEKELKGKPIESLQMPVGDSTISPIAFPSEGKTPWMETTASLKVARPFGGWGQRWDVSSGNIVETNQEIKQALALGADTIGLDFPFETSADLDALFADVQVEIIELHFYGKSTGLERLQVFYQWLGEKNLDTKAQRGSMEWAVNQITNFDFDRLVQLAAPHIGAFKPLSMDVSSYRDLGCSLETSMRMGLTALVHVFSALSNSSTTVDDAAALLSLRMGIGQDYLKEIAALRAIRLLWNAIVSEQNPVHACSTMLHIDAKTSTWNYTARDARSNHLRATSGAMSAIVGGADSLAIEAHSAAYKNANGSAMRLSLNIHHLLRYESYLDKVDDPARGSCMLEKLTEELADRCWEYLREKQDLSFKEQIKALEKDAENERQVEGEKNLLGVNLHPGEMPKDFANFARQTWESTFGKEGSDD